MGIGCGALIAGLFGMNLLNHLEQHPYAFYALSAGSMGVALLVGWSGLRTCVVFQLV
jgi:hypothetical protein